MKQEAPHFNEGRSHKIAARFQAVQIEVFRLGVHDRSRNNFDIHAFVFAGVHVDTRTERVFRSESAAGTQGACCGDRQSDCFVHGGKDQKSFLDFDIGAAVAEAKKFKLRRRF
jgi:hypothetical protein